MIELYYWTGFIFSWIAAILGTIAILCILIWVFLQALSILSNRFKNLWIIIEYAYHRKNFKEWVKNKERSNHTKKQSVSSVEKVD